jgi:hypothetical protein
MPNPKPLTHPKYTVAAVKLAVCPDGIPPDREKYPIAVFKFTTVLAFFPETTPAISFQTCAIKNPNPNDIRVKTHSILRQL